MAAAMMCPAHGPVAGHACIPGCMEPLQPYISTPTEPAATCCAAGCDMLLPCPLHPAGTPDVGHREAVAYRAAAGIPSRQQTPQGDTGNPALEFPWGTVLVTPGGLIVGRDFADGCGDQIDTFDNVSRRHARISLEGGRLFVEDLESTNGTTVNGTPVRPDQRAPLADGDVLGFGNRLRVTVCARGAAR